MENKNMELRVENKDVRYSSRNTDVENSKSIRKITLSENSKYASRNTETENIKLIKELDFGILSPDMIKKMAVVNINNYQIYNEDGFVIPKGLADARMGVITPGVRCETCHGMMDQCYGHFGYLELSRPVINPLFARKIHHLLSYTCQSCGSLLFSDKKKQELDALKKSLESQGRSLIEILGALEDNVKSSEKPKICPFCNVNQDKVLLELPWDYFFNDHEHNINAIQIRTWLEKIKTEDLVYLGFNPANRPEWMVLTRLLVAPLTVRPTITLETGVKAEDDLTHKYADILRINNYLSSSLEKGAPEVVIEDMWSLLQYHVGTLVDNELSRVVVARHSSSNVPLNTLMQRITSKDGMFRSNLLGKRTDYTARSVISGDPYLKLDEIGIPEAVAKNMSILHVVTSQNIEVMKGYVLSNNYPRATEVVLPNGSKRRVTVENRDELAECLAIGWKVYRNAMDGDILIFNRQPTLHKYSMMAFKAKVLPGIRAFRFNVALTSSYNADFDGDEMNMWFLQDIEARAEARSLMSVKYNMLSARDNSLVYKPTHGHISSLFLMSQDKTPINFSESQQILSNCSFDVLANLKVKDSYLPMDLVAALFPTDYEYNGKDVKFKDGIFEGIFTSKTVSALIKDFYIKRTPDETVKLLENICLLSLNYLIQYRGFTIGLFDYVVGKKVSDTFAFLIETKTREVEKKSKNMQEWEIIASLDNITNEIYETLLKNTGIQSSAYVMAASGARGGLPNFGKIVGMGGQQIISEGRPKIGYDERAISHIKRNDPSPEARGFIKSNFKHGLTPREFVFSSYGSRESFITAYTTTPDTGYGERKLIYALQDLYMDEGNTIRDGDTNIVTFEYTKNKPIENTKYQNFDYPPIGSPVGMVIAHALSEKMSQSALSAFHFAGSSGSLIGTMASDDLFAFLEMRAKPPKEFMSIYPKNSADLVKIANQIVQRNVKDYMSEVKLDIDAGTLILTCSDSKDVEFITKQLGNSKIYDLTANGSEMRLSLKKPGIKEIIFLRDRILRKVVWGVSGILEAHVLEDKGCVETRGTNVEGVLKNE
ncbi:MAG: hypothetical protein CVU81_00160, partial [Euryarchaeota archaeon HGW-Euryarchaeota-1]